MAEYLREEGENKRKQMEMEREETRRLEAKSMALCDLGRRREPVKESAISSVTVGGKKEGVIPPTPKSKEEAAAMFALEAVGGAVKRSTANMAR